MAGNYSANNYWIIWLTLFFGLLLQIVPWSSSIYMIKPHWLMLMLIYWLLALPHRVGMVTSFLVGLVLDLFSGTVLGVHAFIFSVIAYLALFKFQLVRNLALWQQSLIIVFFSLVYDFLLFVFEVAIYHVITMSPLMLLSCLLDGLLWGWLFLLLRQIRRHFGVS